MKRAPSSASTSTSPVSLERSAILWVGDLLAGERDKPLELAPSPLARRLRDRRIPVVGEEADRAALAVLLAHEEER